MRLRRCWLFLAEACALSIVACGGSGAESAPTDGGAEAADDTGAADTGPAIWQHETGPKDVGPPIDHGTPSTTYPAYAPDLPMLQNNGGAVLKTPVVVTITWPGERNADAFEKFGDLIGTSSYWKSIASEYGIGPAVSGAPNHVRLTDAAPAAYADYELEQLVQDRAGNVATSKWPAPTEQTIYLMYVPHGTKVSLFGKDACSSGYGGYHYSTDIAGQTVAYAVVVQCKFGGGTTLTQSTNTASHELGEAATDPQPNVQRGYAGFDSAHFVWELFQQYQTENGDACEFYDDRAFLGPDDFPFEVQRQWSNKSAKAGHAPCVPVADGAYFNVVPQDVENVTVNTSSMGGPTHLKTKGFHIGVGETKTIKVGFYSDQATAPWSISVAENNPILGGGSPDHFDVKIDSASGQNGEYAHLAVTVNSAAPSKYEQLVVVSTDSLGNSHYEPILITSE